MNTKILPIALCLCLSTVAVQAQADAKAPKPKEEKSPVKEESITITKKSGNNEKMTIVVDGEHITINGKPLNEMKDSDIEIRRNKALADTHLKIMRSGSPMGNMKIFSDGMDAKTNRAFLGVSSEKSEKGTKIISVEKGSGAEKAGLQKDDIITKAGDAKISSPEDLYEAIGKLKPEDKVSITYLHEGKEATTTATLGKNSQADLRVFNFNNDNFHDFNFSMPEMPRMNKIEMTRKPKLGLEIQDIETGKGVKVLDVDSDSPASKAGLLKDDVISEIDGKAVSSVDELRTKVREMKEGDSVKITFTRNGKTQTAEIKFPRKLKTAEL
ncbi:MAG: hypothetical protein RLZZ28_1356 [Bacteroidota bacterium]|jgi:serine protease Do